MKFKLFVFMLCLGLSSVVNAGFFDSKEEKIPFKCGREDSILAVTEALRDSALSKMSVSSDLLERFQNQVATVPISISDVSTTGGSAQELKCIATVSMTVPAELKELSEKVPEVFSEFIRESHGLYKNGDLSWKNTSYGIRLADNKKDISVDFGGTYYAPMSLASSSYLAIRKDEIIRSNDPSRVTIAKQSYEVEDAHLNKIWKSIPASFRSSMKDEQIAWIWGKESKCGKIESVDLADLSISEQVDRYECQAEMTKNRANYLSGKQ